ncbi:MAG: glycosyltransferase family 4 protein [Gammaproteobacteria bacterium]|nr:glycosyltransferase family 4 protein [Gammaproteobacteria bacterium]
MKPVAVLMASYSPGFPAEHLGATKKIELVAKLLQRMGYELHYVDSGHPEQRLAQPVQGQAAVVGESAVTLWRPACLPHRKVGKLFNVLHAGSLIDELARRKPQLIWLYNSYAFEARWGMALQARTGARLILELEDLPLARHRGLNPKPHLDQWYFQRLLPRADMVTFVNADLMQQYASRVQQSFLLPSVLQDAIATLPDRQRFSNATHRLGYFGGLEVDKGVQTLLELVPRMPERWKLVVTGVGSLTDRLREVAERHPDAIEFHGAVAHRDVIRLMSGCDAIVNPHAAITEMDNGVFPFKVCEALASGALLITTPLPAIDLDLAGHIETFDGSVNELVHAMQRAPALYARRHAELSALRHAVCQRYGETAVFERFNQALHALEQP